MRLIFVFCLLTAVAADKAAKIKNYQFGIDDDGSFKAVYQTTNGIEATEGGVSYPGLDPGTGNYVKSGSFTYEWEGVTYTVVWTADENGFHPEGDHLPDFSHTREHIGGIDDYQR